MAPFITAFSKPLNIQVLITSPLEEGSLEKLMVESLLPKLLELTQNTSFEKDTILEIDVEFLRRRLKNKSGLNLPSVEAASTVKEYVGLLRTITNFYMEKIHDKDVTSLSPLLKRITNKTQKVLAGKIRELDRKELNIGSSKAKSKSMPSEEEKDIDPSLLRRLIGRKLAEHKFPLTILLNQVKRKNLNKRTIDIRGQRISSTIDGNALTVWFDNLMNPIHNNITGVGEIRKEPDFNFCYSIDPSFLLDYLIMLSSIIGKKWSILSEREKSLASLFLTFYDIDFENLIEKNKENERIINFGLDLETIDFSLDDIEEDQKDSIRAYMVKIQAYKLNLRLSLFDFVIYSAFGSFINPFFYDFRGRKYFISHTFNLQGYPFIKAFVKMKSFPQSFQGFFSSWSDIGKCIEDEVNIPFTISVNEYRQSIKEHKLGFLTSFLIEEYKGEFITLFESHAYSSYSSYLFWYQWLKRRIKKKRDLLKILSFILLEKRPDREQLDFGNTYSYDATSSGYQMISLLFRDKKLGEICNIVGDKKRDIYKEANDNFHTHLAFLEKTISDFFQRIDLEKKQRKGEEENWESLLIFFDKKGDLLLHDSITLRELLEKALSSRRVVNIISSFNLISYDWITKSYRELEIYFLDFLKVLKGVSLDLIKTLLIIKKTKEIISWIDTDFRDILKERNLFKKSVMIEIYGGTHSGRRKGFKDHLLSRVLEKGLKNINMPAIFVLADLLESFFQLFREENLKKVDLLMEISKILAKKGKPIKVNTPFFSFSLLPAAFKDKAKRVCIRHISGRKPVRFTLRQALYDTKGGLADLAVVIDQKKLKQIFLPDFVHGMDAFIVHSLSLRFASLFQKLKVYKVEGSLLIIHDNFRFLLPSLTPSFAFHL